MQPAPCAAHAYVCLWATGRASCVVGWAWLASSGTGPLRAAATHASDRPGLCYAPAAEASTHGLPCLTPRGVAAAAAAASWHAPEQAAQHGTGAVAQRLNGLPRGCIALGGARLYVARPACIPFFLHCFAGTTAATFRGARFFCMLLFTTDTSLCFRTADQTLCCRGA